MAYESKSKRRKKIIVDKKWWYQDENLYNGTISFDIDFNHLRWWISQTYLKETGVMISFRRYYS
jgi:hypothetical protein